MGLDASTVRNKNPAEAASILGDLELTIYRRLISSSNALTSASPRRRTAISWS